MLDELKRTIQQQSVPALTARVIESADPPPKWTKPNWKLVCGLSVMLGLGCGIGSAFLREGLKPSVHSSRDIEDITGRPNLGVIPELVTLGPICRQPRWRTSLPHGSVATVEGQRLSRAIPAAALASYHVVLNDEGNIALNTLRSMEVAIRMSSARAAGEGAVVIALGSALAGEGKSTVSALFAMHLARSGARVLLVDYDFRRGGLTRRFQGARHIVQGDAEPSAAHEQQLTGFGRTMMFDPLTGLVFLPAPKRSEAGREISRVISDGTEKQIGILRSCFDYIVLDLPPLFQLPRANAGA
jgi:succinoglycan biosynthesis transport protein ExoP